MTRDFKHSFKAPDRPELSLVVYNAGFQKCPPGYGWGPGIRDHYLIHYILSGHGHCRIGEEQRDLGAGEAFLVRPEVPTHYAAAEEDPWEYYWVGFSGPSAPLLLSATVFAAASVARPQAGDRLRNWPVQIKLAPVHAPYFEGAKLLIAADCTAYAYANFHQEFMRGKVTLIGCPKLDAVDYSEKLTEILRSNDIQSVTILRMEVPCCGGLEMAAKKALQASGKFIPWQVVTISIDGKILD